MGKCLRIKKKIEICPRAKDPVRRAPGRGAFGVLHISIRGTNPMHINTSSISLLGRASLPGGMNDVTRLFKIVRPRESMTLFTYIFYTQDSSKTLHAISVSEMVLR